MPAHAWLFELVALLSATTLVANVCFVLHDGLEACVERFLHTEEGAYAGWSACTLALLSSFVGAGVASQLLWFAAVGLGMTFILFGLRDLWRTHHSIDPAHLSWFAWLGVAAATVPERLALLAPALAMALALAGFVAAVLVLIAAWERVIRHEGFQGARSPWFGMGGAASLAYWTNHHVTPAMQLPLLALLFALGAIWFIPVLQLKVKAPKTRAAWPNLFPLTNLALLCADLQWTGFAVTLAVWAVVIAAIEVRNHVPSTFARSLQKLAASREDQTASVS